MENINQFTRVGTFCEKCRNVMCTCKIGENSAIIDPLEGGLGEPKMIDKDNVEQLIKELQTFKFYKNGKRVKKSKSS